MFWIKAAWDFCFGWAGIDFLIGLSCIAVAVLEPPIVAALIPDLRKWAVAGAVIAFTCMGCIAYGHKNGIDFTRAQWDAALQREAVQGETERGDSERDIGPVATDRGLFRGDQDNRDSDGKQPGNSTQGALRRLAPHHLFGK